VERIRKVAADTSDTLHARLDRLPSEIRGLATDVIRRLGDRIEVGTTPPCATRIRIHGDYHLGQVLFTGEDFVITDFEGEPARPLAERRAKQPPHRDVAGMLRSFHYAAHAGRGETATAEEWAARSQAAFLDGWRAAIADSAIACDEAGERGLLRLFLIEKALYEVGYELNNRPDWLAIPLRGVLSVL
jgi:trehalose synthase-fused probable maltokinase